MLRIQLNGKAHEVPDDATIADLLQQLQINARYCAVERNHELVPREQHSECPVREGDSIEVVTLVGGG
ncbi:MAG: sulfur carrier protein ThiS [Planctomycetaceae bacterium]